MRIYSHFKHKFYLLIVFEFYNIKNNLLTLEYLYKD